MPMKELKDQPVRVVEVYAAEVNRILFGQQFPQGSDPGFVIGRNQFLPNTRFYFRKVIQAFGDCIEIKAAASGEDQQFVMPEQFLYPLQGIAPKIPNRIRLMNGSVLNKVVGYRPEFLGRGNSGPNPHFPVKLPGIKREYLGIVVPGEPDGPIGFANSGGSGNRDNVILHFSGSPHS